VGTGNYIIFMCQKEHFNQTDVKEPRSMDLKKECLLILAARYLRGEEGVGELT